LRGFGLGRGKEASRSQCFVDAFGAETRAVEFDSDDLSSQIRGDCHNAIDRSDRVLDASSRVFAGYGLERPDPMPVPLADFGPRHLCQLLDTVECQDVRVVVETENRTGPALDDVCLGNTTPLD
jgi:hypothetical protein